MEEVDIALQEMLDEGLIVTSYDPEKKDLIVQLTPKGKKHALARRGNDGELETQD